MINRPSRYLVRTSPPERHDSVEFYVPAPNIGAPLNFTLRDYGRDVIIGNTRITTCEAEYTINNYIRSYYFTEVNKYLIFKNYVINIIRSSGIIVTLQNTYSGKQASFDSNGIMYGKI